jgi:hypothetical protein
MPDPMQVIRNKQARGYILKLLELTHPTPTPSTAIQQAMIQDGLTVNQDISEHIDYLRGKGYVDVKDVTSKVLSISVVTLKLTPKGVDLLEETIEDPGVDL